MNQEQNRQRTYNVTLSRVRVTFIVMKMQQYVPFVLLLTYM
jgi:hypothetical protein